MTTRILHQLGHRYKWSLASIAEDHTGDGVIVGPRYMKPNEMSAMTPQLKEASLFDPQFFLPSSATGKLQEYPFFPDILSGGFSTAEWTPSNSSECAERCLEFQIHNGFGALVIPTRFYEGMPSTFIASQESQFVIPFLEGIEPSGAELDIYLQLILTDQMLKDESYRTEVLNWITSFPEISGVYLIPYIHSRGKQINDIDLLVAWLDFVEALKLAGMFVVVGYVNTESLLLLCAEPDAVTMGSYENLRMFSLRSFEPPQRTPMRGPNARVYIPRLLDWVEYQYIGAIERVVDDLGDYIGDDDYRVRMFEPAYNWHFTKPEPYRHYFRSFHGQFTRLVREGGGAVVDRVVAECEGALGEFQMLRESGVVFPPGSSGEHVAAWLTAINMWRSESGS